MESNLSRLVRRLDAALLPAHCWLCGVTLSPATADSAHRNLCTACHADLVRNHPACRGCALPLPDTSRTADAADRLCGSCLTQRPAFDWALALFDYRQPLDAMIHRFKFNADRVAERILSQLLAAEVPRHIDADLLIPVPLHASRLQQRGFNQAERLATALHRVIAENQAIELRRDSLSRVRATTSQTELSARERRANVKNAFRVNHPDRIAGRRIAIVDDVLTSGSTAAELSRLLKANGAAQVGVIALARALPGR